MSEKNSFLYLNLSLEWLPALIHHPVLQPHSLDYPSCPCYTGLSPKCIIQCLDQGPPQRTPPLGKSLQ